MKFPHLLALGGALGWTLSTQAVPIAGQIRDASSNAIATARVTLFTSELRYFRETRTDVAGAFEFKYVAAGTYRLGLAASGYEYREISVSVSNAPVAISFSLVAETNGGRWTIVGNTEPELLDGSGSGSLLPSGEVLFCHNTEEPIAFDPVSAVKWYPPDSGTAQGCHMVTVNTDGGLLFVGGSMGGNPLDPVVKFAKTYWRSTNAWVRNADMNVARWYAGLCRLPDERLLVLGGELDNPSYGRTNGCEIYNSLSNSWTITGSFNLPTEIPPALLLFTGEVLKTWRYPELYSVSNGTWRPAPNMIQPRLGASGGDHADHEIVFLPDGRVMAVGIAPLSSNADPRFVEFYNPTNNAWTLGPNPRALRNRPEALILPDGRVLSFGGQYSGNNPPPVPLANAGTIPNCTKVADLFDPASNSWRPLADMNRFIHYHNVAVLVPDGRVIATGGAGLTSNSSFAGDDASIEAFEPPYLFRGVRPRLDWLSTTELVPGSNFNLRVSLTEAVSRLVLVSARATTHWVDGGAQRFLSLDFVQNRADIQATIPADPVEALAGYYILFALVDDIPSVGRIIRITPALAPRPPLPSVSLSSADSTAAEPGSNIATFTLTRSGPTSTPMPVNYTIGGTAVNGDDYDALLNFVLIPTGDSSATVTVTPSDDALAEGAETISISIDSTAAYSAGATTNVVITLTDNEPSPPDLRLTLNTPNSSRYALTVSGAASGVADVETSNNFTDWEFLTSIVNATGTNRLVEAIATNALFFRARQAQ
jgi:hypothetical protein